MGEIFPLKNKIQNYAWGSHEVLGRMRGVPVPTEKPEAEVGWGRILRLRLKLRSMGPCCR